MSQISKYFKVSKTNTASSKTSQHFSTFATKKVEQWIERLNLYTERQSIECESLHSSITSIEEDDDVDELDWDDTGSVISTNQKTKRSSATTQKSLLVVDFPSRKRKSEDRNTFNNFVRPLTPMMTRTSAKIFKPVVLIHNQEAPTDKNPLCPETAFLNSNSSTQNDQNSINRSNTLLDLNESFASNSSSIVPEACVTTCFQNISAYLEDISSYCPSLSESQRANMVSHETQTEMNITGEDSFYVLPKRTFDDNSVDPILAFGDNCSFIRQIYEEDLLFESEHNVDEYLDSQLFESQKDLSVKVVSTLDFTIEPDLPSGVQMLQKGLNKIVASENFKSSIGYERPSPEINNDRVRTRIRTIIAQLNKDLENKQKLQIKVPKVEWKTTVYEDGVLVLNKTHGMKLAILRGRTNLVLYMLRKVQGLLAMNTQLTQRSIYYQLKSLLPERKLTQQQVTDALNIICSMLDTPYWNLNVLSTSKGLIYGDLTMTIGSTRIKCNAQNGTLVPMDLNDLQRVESTAYFILIVEKDTVFQKLLVDDLPNKLSRNFILVTGKGYPDITTRRLLNILWRLLGIPMFIVVDADAYGIDIFLTYKFGSLNNCHMNKELALPKLKWLGVLPSEMKDYKVKTLPLKPNDRKKLNSMLSRPYFQNGHNCAIRAEINTLIESKRMCEIEGLFESNMFFAEYYLPAKLYKHSFL